MKEQITAWAKRKNPNGLPEEFTISRVEFTLSDEFTDDPERTSASEILFDIEFLLGVKQGDAKTTFRKQKSRMDKLKEFCEALGLIVIEDWPVCHERNVIILRKNP